MYIVMLFVMGVFLYVCISLVVVISRCGFVRYVVISLYRSVVRYLCMGVVSSSCIDVACPLCSYVCIAVVMCYFFSYVCRSFPL